MLRLRIIMWLIILFHARMLWPINADPNRPGYITIDCGNEAPDTQNHRSEAEFIDTGVSVQLPPKYHNEEPLYNSVRSFPDGKRNCYTLRPTDGKMNRYLIRTRFMYGDYDKKNSMPVFDLYLGANLWTRVNFTAVDRSFWREMVYKPTSDFVSVCLVNIDQGTPFISSLELRPLNNDIYNRSSSLQMISRFDASEKTPTSVRNYDSYEADEYDRFWAPFLNQETQQYWTTEPTNLTTSSLRKLKDNEYKIPKTIFESKAVPISGVTLSIIFRSLIERSDYYLYWHFANTESGLREFDIYLKNKASYSGRYSLSYMQETTISTTEPVKLTASETTLEFSIIGTTGSKLLPILNAVELYRDLKFQIPETFQDDVNAMMDMKDKYKSSGIKGWQGDPCLPIQPWDGLNCSNTTDAPPRVTSLNLSSKGFTGEILLSLSNLTSLTYLDLSNNSLTGTIPEFLADMPSLKDLNLGGNNLSGSVPAKLKEKQKTGSLSLRLEGNPELCTSKACLDKNKNREMLAYLIAAAVILCLLVMAVLFAYKWRTTKGFNSRFKSKNQHFSHSEIVEMTNSFSRELGKGGFGTVYHGSLKDKTQVAVKMLNKPSGFKSFQTEAELLIRVHHKNLVSLVGYCDEGKTTALIYEYMAKGDVYNYLKAKEKDSTASWKERLQIACDAAQGLEYLHRGCTEAIIHRDIKTANILLDGDMRAKVADLRMSRIFAKKFTDEHITLESVAGTIGYLDPEYQITFKLNEKSDVYSFGVVLLELITGRSPIMKTTKDEHINITTWARLFFERGEFQNILDPSFGGNYTDKSAWKAVDLAMACVLPSGIQRPTMSEVSAELKECLKLEEKAAKKKGADHDDTQQCSSSSDIVIDDVHINSKPAGMVPMACKAS